MAATIKSRRTLSEQNLAQILREASGLDLDKLNRSATFLELGFDSLFLIQLSQRLKRKFGVKIAFRQLIEDVSTVESLIDYLAEHGKFESVESNTQSAVSIRPPMPEDAHQVKGPATQPNVAADVSPATHVNSSIVAASRSIAPSLPGPTIASKQPTFPAISPPPAFTVPAATPVAMSGMGGKPLESSNALEQIILQQNQLMMRHLEILCGQTQAPYSSTNAESTLPLPSVACEEVACEIAASGETSLPEVIQPDELVIAANQTIDTNGSQAVKAKVFERFGPYKPVRKGSIQGLTEKQYQHLQSFIDRYTKRTAKSRRHAGSHRTQFADPRGVAGYRRIWKSMVYQIVVERSKGSKLWDIDGNEYVDIAMGFGLNLFGQSPDFVTQALHRQLDLGVEVGPQTPLTGEVASLLCQFSRKDRATFCNTGSEAVMAALRLARTVTGKTKTVFFNKDYHGNFDQVLMRSQGSAAQANSAPAAPGVPQWYADNTIVLPYGAEESLRIIEENADDIAAVLVEPCQSADPFIQPREFLLRLREITRDRQIALVMDEVITGFRAAQGGAQEWYGVWGDMATYGKILGGGMPIGALAGSREYMDALDGGDWRYEDDSEPDADMTFFAGTFVRHPLAIAAAYEVLKKIKEEGPQLQQNLTNRTTHLATTLNNFFEAEQFPIRVAQFSSLFRFMFPPDLEFADMLYFHMLDRGVFTRGWGDNCFLSTAHSEGDIAKIIRAVKESCLEIRDAGFFPEKDPTGTGVNLKKKLLTESSELKGKPESIIPFPITNSRSSTHESCQAFEFDPDRMSTVNPIHEEGDRPPIFCMPAADGLTLVYHELSSELGANQPVYGLDSPAIYREAIPDTLEELAARFIADLKEVQPEGPYYLVGYCSGGTTALEVAQQLIRSGDQVALLAMIETYNWLTLPSTKPTFAVQAYYQFERVKFHCYNFWLLDSKSKSKFFRSKFQSLVKRTKVWKGAIKGLFRKQSIENQSGLVNMSEIWRKHDDIAETYVPQKYPGTMVQFRPIRDYRCNIGTEYEANEIDYRVMKVYPAGMMASPFVKELAAQLDQLIDKAWDNSDARSIAGRERA